MQMQEDFERATRRELTRKWWTTDPAGASLREHLRQDAPQVAESVAVRIEEAIRSFIALPAQLVTFARLAIRYAETLESSILQISAETDDLEDRVLAEGDDPPLGALNVLRYQAFQVRRQLVPLRNLLNFIAADPSLQIDSDESNILSAASEQVVHYLEGLDDCRERAQLLHDQIEGQFAATMTRVSYNLTIVATVFLPLSFITGLLGMNVGGMPEEHNPWGFWLVCVSLMAIAVFSWSVLRWRKWV